MADKTVRGRFVWHELLTPDSAAAQVFYGKALGWKTQAWEADPSYSMFAAGSGPVGGVVAESAEKSHWIPYVASADLESTVREAQELGASVLTDITPISAGGRYAILRDPQGAKLGVYASDAPAQKEKAPQRGEFSWHELATTDAPAALDFYSKLFGWEQLDKHDMGPLGFYYIFGRNGTPIGGAFNLMAGMPDPAWVGYVRVKDLDKVVKRVKSGGGTLINGPMEVPGGDWIAQFTDPSGAMFAVHVVKADRESAAAEPAPSAAPAAVPAAAAPAEKAAPAAAKPAASKPAAARKPAAKKAKTKTKTKAKAKAKAKTKVVSRKQPAKKKAGKKVVKRAAAKAAKRGARKTAKARGKAAKKTQKRAVAKKKAARARKKARRGK